MNLIELCNKKENLSLIQKITIKQEVSFAFEFVLNGYIRNCSKESKAFGTYICLIKANPELYGNYIEELIDGGWSDEDTINDILVYIRSGITPYNVWIDKLVSDIYSPYLYNKTSVQGMLTVYLLKTLRCSLIAFNKVTKYLTEECNLDEDLLQAVEYAKVKYMELPDTIKSDYAKAFNATTEEDRRKFQDNELSLFSETLGDQIKYPLNIALIEAVDDIPSNDYRKYILPIWEEPMMGMSNAGGQTLQAVGPDGNPVEGGVQSIAFNIGKKGGMGIFIENVLEYTKKAQIKKQDEELAKVLGETEIYNKPIQEVHELSNKPSRYVVRKVAKDGSTRVMSENWFNSKQEAEQFKESIEKANPEIIKYFNFVVEAGD